MKELNRTRRLTIATIVFVAIIAIGLFTLNRPQFEYQVTPEEMMKLVQDGGYAVSPEEAKSIIEENSTGYQFIDLRNQESFNRGSLPGAINIPVSDMLEPENIGFYRDMAGEGVQLVLFAEDQQAVNGPWMVLRQIGMENVMVLMGGYVIVNAYLLNDTDNKPFLPEEPQLNYAKFMDSLGIQPANPDENSPLQIQTVPRKKKTVVEGGC